VRRALTVLTILAVVAGAAVVAWSLGRSSVEPTEPDTTITTATALVVRTDLVQTKQLRGSLRYSDPRTVATALGGTLTGLPDEASRLERGSEICEIDGAPVVLLYGERPAWRPFQPDMDDGPDVLQLEENLVALGYLDAEPDDEYGTATRDAVEAWREDLGLTEGEFLELGRVVFLPGAVRTGSGLVDVGRSVAPGTPLLEVSSFDQEVVIDLDPADLDLVGLGDPVVITLPDGREVPGRVASIGRVVRPSGPEPGAPEVIEVRVALGATGIDLEAAPVDVEVESDRAAGVLAVPVRALVALSDGGYAVEVVRADGSTELVGVETGDFAGGLVEVAGALAEGDEVVVPA
jgi:peptidoglycan hydrolase-like protein with peptidoglycan-binding domain